MKIDYEKAYQDLSMLPMRDEVFRGILSIALQKNQEREKGCPECINSDIFDYMGVPVKYCPMCGSKIKKNSVINSI